MKAGPAAALAVLAAWTLVTIGGSMLQADGDLRLDRFIGNRPVYAFVAAIGLLLAAVAGLRWRSLGLCRPDPSASARTLWLPAIYILVFLGLAVAQGLPPLSMLAVILFNTLLVGVSEELMFRGILLDGLGSRMSAWSAIWLTTALFGAVHLLNAVLTGEPGPALVQSGQAFMTGLFYLALRVRTGSLLPGMLAHGLWNFSVVTLAASAGAGGTPDAAAPAVSLFPLLLVLPLFLYGLWLLRGHAD